MNRVDHMKRGKETLPKSTKRQIHIMPSHTIAKSGSRVCFSSLVQSFWPHGKAPASLPALADIKAAVRELLPLVDWQRCTNKDFRIKVEQHLQVAAATLDPVAQEMQAMAQEELQSQKA